MIYLNYQQDAAVEAWALWLFGVLAGGPTGNDYSKAAQGARLVSVNGLQLASHRVVAFELSHLPES